MDAELLQTAINALSIRDVYFTQSKASILNGFDPKYDPRRNNLGVAFRHEVDCSEIVKLNVGSNEQYNIFRVFINLGARFGGDTDTDEKEVVAQVESTFVAEYFLKNDVPQEALAEFALNNASFHIWPYWREYLMSQCLRMNLPKIALPIHQVASNQKANVTGVEGE